MLTIRGWALLGAGLAITLLWYTLGDPELLLTGVFLSVVSLTALLYVRYHRPRVSIARRLGSTTVHNGDTTSVTLLLVNHGDRPVRNVSLADEVQGLGLASFEIAGLMPGQSASATYRVTCRPRGVYEIGPASFSTTDPLGLAELPAQPGAVDRIVVYPTVEELTGFPLTRGQDPALNASRPEHSQRGGEDFYTLREYQRGDDLRRIHWPSSAKTEELMIRQLETPWQSRALVLLDVRQSVYESAEAFETSVSGAASVVTHLVRSGFDADLWAGDASIIDATKYATAMERLALVEPDPLIDITAVGSRIRQTGGGGALVLVTGQPDRDLLGVQQLLANQYRSTILLGVATTTAQTLIGFQRLGATTVTIEPGEDWQHEWSAAMRAAWDVA